MLAVTNITGLRISWRGSSLRKASRIAGAISSAVNSDLLGVRAIRTVPSEGFAADHRKMIGDGAKRQARQESEAAEDQDDPHEQAHPQSTRGRERARAFGRVLLRGEAAGDRQHRHDDEEAAE